MHLFLFLSITVVVSENPPFCGSGQTTTNNSFEVCTGVRGNSRIADDHSGNVYADFLKKYDVSKVHPCGSKSLTGIPEMDLWGKCQGNENTISIPKLSPLITIPSKDFSSLNSLNDKFWCLHKIWGLSPSFPHNGVTCENINVGRDIVVDYTGKSTVQDVVELNTRGDLYTGSIKGIHDGGNKPVNCSDCGIMCPDWQSTASGKRTGAGLVTKDMYGPGTFKVRAMVPKTSDAKTDGRGYVFAIWMYHYEEIYNDTVSHPLGSQYVEDPVEFQAGSEEEGWYTPWTHEIDIEIPSNSPQFKSSWKDNLGWNTMNMNSWIGDNANYTATGNNFYQQLQVNAPPGKTFISDDGRYHDYEFQWHVDNSDYTKNFVQYSFDGEVIWKSYKFVPTRPGRLNVGPWPAWWSVDPDDPNADFDTATVKIASIEITPQEGYSPVVFPQTYDQSYKTSHIQCDYKSFSRRRMLFA